MRSSDRRAAVGAAALALLVVMTACAGNGGDPGAAGLGVVRWRGQSDGADGMLVSGDTLYVAGPFVVTAFDTESGDVRWEAEMSDTSGVTPMSQDGDVVVVAPEFEGVQAFDARTGEPAAYHGEPPSAPYADFELPPDYRYTRGELSFDGTVLWDGGDPEYAPQVGRLGRMTIVNDFDTGLSVVADDGDVLFHAQLGTPMFDESAVLVVARERVAFTLTADGKLWAIQEPEG